MDVPPMAEAASAEMLTSQGRALPHSENQTPRGLPTEDDQLAGAKLISMSHGVSAHCPHQQTADDENDNGNAGCSSAKDLALGISAASASGPLQAMLPPPTSIIEKPPSAASAMVKYGELVILGYNGSLPQGDRGRRRSKFVLFRRPKPNGVARSKHYKVKTPQSSQAILDARQHSISYTLRPNQAVIVEYAHDDKSDMFQIGRSSESPIDFVVMDTVAGNKVHDKASSQSTISRFACRLLCRRATDELQTRIFAAGFDASRNIFLGEKATKWEEPSDKEVDGLTTNGVLLMQPKGIFCPSGGSTDADEKAAVTAEPGIWREVSVGGHVFGLRESRSATHRGPPVSLEDNVLRDGTLIDLCGATLLWRSAEGLAHSPTLRQLERQLDALNAGRPQCPVGLHTLVVPRKNSTAVAPESQPVVYLQCGHVQGRHNWGDLNDAAGTKTCPICLGTSSVAPMAMGSEPAFYVDCRPPDFCFVPCGHMASERTVKYWSAVPIPCGTSGFQSACPFCAVPLTGTPGYIKLIFAQS